MTQNEVYQYTYEFGYGFNLINDAYNNISESIAAEDHGLPAIAKNKSCNAVEFAKRLSFYVDYCTTSSGYVSYGYPCKYAERIEEYCSKYASKNEDWCSRYISDGEPRKDLSYDGRCSCCYSDEFKIRELAFFSQEPSDAIVCYYGNTGVAVYIEPDGFKIILLNYTPSLFSLDNENDKNEIRLYKNECKNRGNFIKQYNGVVFIPFTPYNFKKAILDAGDSASKVLGNLHPLITPR